MPIDKCRVYMLQGQKIPAGIYLLKLNNRKTKTMCEICSKLTIKTPETIVVSL